jgi:hypothetical protein
VNADPWAEPHEARAATEAEKDEFHARYQDAAPGEPDTCRSHPDGCDLYPDTDRCGSHAEADYPETDGGAPCGFYHAVTRGVPEFPEGYQGAGPMYAAVPLGNPWLEVASAGASTYILESPYGLPDGMTDADAEAAYFGYAGNSAFLDRAQAEQVADGRGDGTFVRYEGLTGWTDWSREAQRQFEAADREPADGLAEAEAQ